MLKSSLAFLAFASLTFAQSQTFTYTYSGLSVPVYPDEANVISVANIFVPRGIIISNVTVSVQVQFSGVGDLNIYMYSPLLTRVKLLERNCGNLQNVDTSFDDAAPTRYSDACPTQAGQGPFRGNEPLSNVFNQNAFGTWRLAVENNGSDRTGLLTGFSITITGNGTGAPTIGPNTVVSAASLAPGTVAPGDQLAIIGVNLGPSTGVRANATAPLPTSLGGTTVLFDGTAAPLSYVSDKLVLVQAPTGLSAGSTTRVQVNTASGSSSAVQVNVAATNPGIVTADALGHGQAKAINQDGTANGDGSVSSSDRPAAAGTVIAVYATGLGAVTPTIPAGTPPPSSPLSTVVAPVTATIGGQTAQVLFAGAAPGVTGTYQVNVMVPANARSGTLKLVITAGGASTQDNVTVQIK